MHNVGARAILSTALTPSRAASKGAAIRDYTVTETLETVHLRHSANTIHNQYEKIIGNVTSLL